MKHLRKLALLLAVITLLASLCACGEEAKTENSKVTETATKAEEATTLPVQQETNTPVITDTPINPAPTGGNYITTKDSFNKELDTLLPDAAYTLDESSVTNGTLYIYTLTDKKDYALDYRVKLSDGAEFTLPVMFSDLANAGWTIPKGSGDNELAPGYATSGVIRNNSGKEISVVAYNPTSVKDMFKNGAVCKVEFAPYLSDGSVNSKATRFTVCESITESSTVKDVIDRLGAPSKITHKVRTDDSGAYEYSELMLEYTQKSDPNSFIRFNFSGDNNYITKVEYEHVS